MPTDRGSGAEPPGGSVRHAGGELIPALAVDPRLLEPAPDLLEVIALNGARVNVAPVPGTDDLAFAWTFPAGDRSDLRYTAATLGSR